MTIIARIDVGAETTIRDAAEFFARNHWREQRTIDSFTTADVDHAVFTVANGTRVYRICYCPIDYANAVPAHYQVEA